jgi:hypothetical protein
MSRFACLLAVLSLGLSLASGCGGGHMVSSTAPTITSSGSTTANGSGASSTPSGSASGTAASGTSATGSGTGNVSGTTTSSSSGPGQSQSSTFIFVQNSQGGMGLQELRFNSDSSIQPVAGSPFATAGQPFGIAGNYLIAGAGANMIAAYSVSPSTGAVTKTSSAVPGGTVAGSSNFVYAGTTNAIYGYALSNGELTAVPGSPFEVTIPNPCSCATPDYGSLQIVQGYLFYMDNADHSGSSANVAKIQDDGSFIPKSFAPGNGGELVASPNGKFVYVSDSGASSLELFTFDSATGSVQAAGSTGPDVTGIINSTSSFMFTAGLGNGGTIDTYSIDPQSGMFSIVSSAQDPQGTPVAIDPSNKYLLTLDHPTSNSAAIGVWSIDAATGALSQVNSYSLGSYSNTYAAGGFVVGKFQ